MDGNRSFQASSSLAGRLGTGSRYALGFLCAGYISHNYGNNWQTGCICTGMSGTAMSDDGCVLCSFLHDFWIWSVAL